MAWLQLHTLFKIICLNYASAKARPERVVQEKCMLARYRLQVNTEGKGPGEGGLDKGQGGVEGGMKRGWKGGGGRH